MNGDIKTSDLMYGNHNQCYQRSVNNTTVTDYDVPIAVKIILFT